jgi:hypothetical protein
MEETGWGIEGIGKRRSFFPSVKERGEGLEIHGAAKIGR